MDNIKQAATFASRLNESGLKEGEERGERLSAERRLKHLPVGF